MLSSLEHLLPSHFPHVYRDNIKTVQANLGYLCNQQCLHCHVNAGPKRTELMNLETMRSVFDFIDHLQIATLDLTGGAPEMNPHFRWMVEQAGQRGMHTIDRCNLTILSEPGYDWLAPFLAENRVEVVASLPCYLKENVEKQRGKGTFDRSIDGLLELNRLGYGEDIPLNLVFNPQGAELPPPQARLEADYHRFLSDRYGVVFNHLYTIANMPIQRFGSMLLSKGLFHDYLQTLKSAHKTENLSTVMCRSMISVGWDGIIYDCDFNQMLNLPVQVNQQTLSLQSAQNHIADIPIITADHCWGCTAGQGSSCGGALLDE